MTVQRDEVADCVATLAEEIARLAPDCAEKAMRIVDLVQDLRHEPDRTTIQEVLETHLLAAEVSDSQVQLTTSAVFEVVKTRTEREIG